MKTLMEIVTLRRAGGSLVLTIPRTYTRALGLTEGERVGVSVAEGKLVVDPATRQRPRYRLSDLVAECDPAGALTAEDEHWLGGHARGDEAL
jgi:antitoxin ChpS